MNDTIGPDGYKISLLSTTPGKSVEVAANFRKAIHQGTGSAPICLLQLFGKYDICSIYRTQDYLSGPSKAGSIKNIRGSNLVFAFPWLPAGRRKIFSRKRSFGNIWGLLFFRTNETLARRFGAWIEQYLVSFFSENRPENVELDILGTPGWAELIFIVRGNRFSDVLSALAHIGGQAVAISNQGKHSEYKNLFSAKTFSLIGIDFDLVKNGDKSVLKRVFDEGIDDGSGIFPRLNITCAPGDMQTVFSEATRRIGRGYHSYGSFDLTFHANKCSTWGEFMGNVLELRRDFKDNLYATSVQMFREPGDDDYPSFPSQVIKREGIDVDSELIRLFKRWGLIFPRFCGHFLKHICFSPRSQSDSDSQGLNGVFFDCRRLRCIQRYSSLLADDHGIVVR